MYRNNMFHEAKHVLLYKFSHLVIESPSKSSSNCSSQSGYQQWEQTSKAQNMILFKTEAQFYWKATVHRMSSGFTTSTPVVNEWKSEKNSPA